jgi:hypothetical protein
MKFLSLAVRSGVPGLSAAAEVVQDIANATTEFLQKWAEKFMERGRKVFEPLAEKAKELRSDIERRQASVHQMELNLAKSGGATKEAQEALQKAKDELKEKEKALKETEQEAENNRKVPGTGELLGEMLNDLAQEITKRVMPLIEPHAQALLQKGFSLVRQLVEPIIEAVCNALGNIPYVGPTLSSLALKLAHLALDKLEEAAFDALWGLAERVLTKLVRSVISPIFKKSKGVILKLVMKTCKELFPDICPKKGTLEFAELPPKDRWIGRALACPGREILDRKVYEDAAVAELQMHGLAAEMRKEVATYAREIGNDYLARYGFTVDSWIAAVGRSPRSRTLARARAIDEGLGKLRDSIRVRRAR